MTRGICLWSGPRNVSTAMMYSFAQRNDIHVVDEPLYAHYLRVTGRAHPGRDEIMATMNSDGSAVMRDLLQRQTSQPSKRLFLKHMAHHLLDIDLGFLRQTDNVFLIRNPREMLPSLTIQIPNADLDDTGLKRQWQLLTALEKDGQSTAVIDSKELLLDPKGVLTRLCTHIELDFDPAMLTWEPGPRAEDGVWAPHWYHAVHKSSGFSPYQSKEHFPPQLQSLLDACQPWYENLYERAIRATA